MISNVLNILQRWCQPLGEILPEQYIALRNSVSPATLTLNTQDGKAIAVYKQGGETKRTKITGLPATVTIPSDAGQNMYIYAKEFLTLTANEAKVISVRSETITQIECDAPIEQIDARGCTNLQNILFSSLLLNNLYLIYAHAKTQLIHDDIIDLCQASTYGGQKRLYLYPDDAYYSQTKTDAQNEGWVVFDLPI